MLAAVGLLSVSQLDLTAWFVVQVMMMSDDFHKFFDRATRVVERALYEDANLFVDYTGGYNDGEGLEDKVSLSH